MCFGVSAYRRQEHMWPFAALWIQTSTQTLASTCARQAALSTCKVNNLQKILFLNVTGYLNKTVYTPSVCTRTSLIKKNVDFETVTSPSTRTLIGSQLVSQWSANCSLEALISRSFCGCFMFTDCLFSLVFLPCFSCLQVNLFASTAWSVVPSIQASFFFDEQVIKFGRRSKRGRGQWPPYWNLCLPCSLSTKSTLSNGIS